jgi:raffinose/stachyose/melibiose transport system permease protein
MTAISAPRGGSPLATMKKIFFPVSPTYLLMIIPAIALFTFFIIYPAVEGMFYSFTNYVGYGTWHFVGFANFQAAFADPTIRDSYGFTLLFAVVACIVTNVVAMALAIALSSRIKWRAGFRTVFFMPMVISGLVISYVFTFIISTSVPIIAGEIHFAPLESSILANQHTAWLGIVFVASWVAVPGAIIIFLAGLVSIPSEVYEAASIDGASAWKQFQKMTFPLLFPFFIINTILTFKAFLNVYDICVGLTGGGPGTATTSVAMTIFSGFFSGDYAYQMANAVIFFVITLFFALFQLSVIRRRGGSL